MRISIDEKDAGYEEVVRRGLSPAYCHVFLDGKQLHHVITADDDVGLLIAWKHNQSGGIVIENGIPLTEILYGKVEIRLNFRNDGTWPHRGVECPAPPSVPSEISPDK